MAAFGQQNLLSLADSVTASSEASGFPIANGYNGFLFDNWKAGASGAQTITADLGTSRSFNYLGIASHNLFSSGVVNIAIQTSTDNVTYTTVQSLPLTNDKNYFALFDTITTRYVRLSFTATIQAPSIANIAFGAALIASNPDYGYSPPVVNNRDEVVGNSNVNGIVLGQSLISGGASTNVNINFQTAAFTDGDWASFVELSTTVPFFYSWDSDNPSQVLYGLADSKKNPTIPAPNLRNISITINGVLGGGVNYISDPDAGGPSTPPPASTTNPFTFDSTLVSFDSEQHSWDSTA